jgi:rhodanese-related sulfurtransferase
VTITTTLTTVSFDDALAAVDDGAAFIDLRAVDEYLDVHIPGSLELLYEFGPGMAARARDCLPLDLPMLLLEAPNADLVHAAASLRGKGFTVIGRVSDGINQWAAARGAPASTEIITTYQLPPGMVLDVGDPGAQPVEGAGHIPVEKLWGRAAELAGAARVIVVAGYGVRAALAVGLLERAGIPEVLFWRTR